MRQKNTSQNLFIAMLYLTLSILAGCGTKGPLYIPEQRYPQGAENNSVPINEKQHVTGLRHSSTGLQANIHAHCSAYL